MAKPIEDEILDIIARELDASDLPSDEKDLNGVISQMENDE